MGIGIDVGAHGTTIALHDGTLSTWLPEPSRRTVTAQALARVGDPVPVFYREANGTVRHHRAHALYADAVASAMAQVGVELNHQGGREVAVALPAWWTARATSTTRDAIHAVAGRRIVLVSDAQAAVRGFRPTGGQELDDVVAVLDLGAQTCSATVVSECLTSRPEVVGTPGILIHEGGDELDARILHHLLDSIRDQGFKIDPTDLETISAARQFLLDCRTARESMSTRSAVTVEPRIPSVDAPLRLVRSEFDELARDWSRQVVSMLEAAILSTGRDVSSVLISGGLARTPIIAQRISADLGLSVLLDPEPASTVARGAKLSAGTARPRIATSRPTRRKGTDLLGTVPVTDERIGDTPADTGAAVTSKAAPQGPAPQTPTTAPGPTREPAAEVSPEPPAPPADDVAPTQVDPGRVEPDAADEPVDAAEVAPAGEVATPPASPADDPEPGPAAEDETGPAPEPEAREGGGSLEEGQPVEDLEADEESRTAPVEEGVAHTPPSDVQESTAPESPDSATSADGDTGPIETELTTPPIAATEAATPPTATRPAKTEPSDSTPARQGKRRAARRGAPRPPSARGKSTPVTADADQPTDPDSDPLQNTDESAAPVAGPGQSSRRHRRRSDTTSSATPDPAAEATMSAGGDQPDRQSEAQPTPASPAGPAQPGPAQPGPVQPGGRRRRTTAPRDAEPDVKASPVDETEPVDERGPDTEADSDRAVDAVTAVEAETETAQNPETPVARPRRRSRRRATARPSTDADRDAEADDDSDTTDQPVDPHRTDTDTTSEADTDAGTETGPDTEAPAARPRRRFRRRHTPETPSTDAEADTDTEPTGDATDLPEVGEITGDQAEDVEPPAAPAGRATRRRRRRRRHDEPGPDLTADPADPPFAEHAPDTEAAAEDTPAPSDLDDSPSPTARRHHGRRDRTAAEQLPFVEAGLGIFGGLTDATVDEVTAPADPDVDAALDAGDTTDGSRHGRRALLTLMVLVLLAAGASQIEPSDAAGSTGRTGSTQPLPGTQNPLPLFDLGSWVPASQFFDSGGGSR